MNDSIQQIAVNFITNVLNYLQDNGIQSIGAAATQLHRFTKAAAAELLCATLHEMDNALVAANKERKQDGLRIKQREVPRTILTELGELCYTRTYFESGNKKRSYLLDHLIGVEPYERLSHELCAALVQNSANMSMEKAAKTLDVSVSRQTVNNKVIALCEVCVEAKPAKETPRELHLFADEDHVHMKNGRNAMVPLVTVTEGIDVSQRRHKTIDPVHFEGYGMDNQDFFAGISSFLYEKYNMQCVEQIYVHGDGGRWIEAARDWFPNTRFVMDGFHLEKRLRQLSRLPEAAKRMGKIRKAIREDDLTAFVTQCAAIDEKLDESDKKSLMDNVNFIQNHWKAIVLRMQNTTCGSCTEPLVSHVLSARLSRHPLAWSEHGLRQMAMLRVYTKNGGIVTAKDVRISRSRVALDADKKSHESGYSKYRKLADKQIDSFLNTKCDWSIFTPPRGGSGKLDATGILKKSFGTMHDIFAVG